MLNSFGRWCVFVVVTLAFSTAAFGQTCSGMSLGQGASLNGFVPFPTSNLWNTDISAAPVDPNSANIINFIGSTVTLHPDFGAGTFQNQTLGIPYQVEAGTQPKVGVKLGAFASESDPGPEPIPSNALIEGYPKQSTATATCWCSKKTAAGFMSSVMPRSRAEIGAPIPSPSGT
jgi:hypothetical protein